MGTYPSVLLEKAVGEFSKLPGIGRKTALRLVLHVLRQPVGEAEAFADAVLHVRKDIKYCSVCDRSTICVVENVQDVMAIENTQQYNGLYHVLGGVISPMDGVGPGDLQIESLVQRVKDNDDVKEIILALSSTMEGDTTNFYIHRQLAPLHVKVTMIARGISVGNDLEYTDEVTLGRSIVNRTLMD